MYETDSDNSDYEQLLEDGEHKEVILLIIRFGFGTYSKRNTKVFNRVSFQLFLMINNSYEYHSTFNFLTLFITYGKTNISYLKNKNKKR